MQLYLKEMTQGVKLKRLCNKSSRFLGLKCLFKMNDTNLIHDKNHLFLMIRMTKWSTIVIVSCI